MRFGRRSYSRIHLQTLKKQQKSNNKSTVVENKNIKESKNNITNTTDSTTESLKNYNINSQPATLNSSKTKQSSSSNSQQKILISLIILIILFLCAIIYGIYLIYKRYITQKKYNQTPEHFTQQPELTSNQNNNLQKNHIKYLSIKNYDKSINNNNVDVNIEQKNDFSGKFYTVQFYNKLNQKYSSVYWSKQLKTDCYFEVEMLSLNSQIEIGYVNSTRFKALEDGFEKNIGRIGFSVNSQGNAQLMGETKYQYKWRIDYGDVIGVGITKIDKEKRIWITKNGILLNPPTKDEIQKWMNKQNTSKDNKQFNTSLLEYQNMNSYKLTDDQIRKINKQNVEMSKRKLVLPQNQKFQYYAMIWCWQLEDKKEKRKKNRTQTQFQKTNKTTHKIKQPTIINVNVGGKVFRIRDQNLKSGLLADPYQKREWCRWPFICC